jgi:ubiquinone/menaquinone biosynthesis C-methylase UbiE
MAQSGFQLSGAAAQLYEDQKVPAMFRPLAVATLDELPVAASDVVLDVACGTGIVSRTILSRFGEGPSVTGVDLNEGMIAAARRVCEREGLPINLHRCDASATPFDDGEFTYVICQQGLQFFPDENAALSEFRRVSQPGAQLVFTVWSRPLPLIVALSDSLRRHVDDDVADRVLAPFSWTGAETIASRLEALGYIDIDHRELVVNRVIGDPTSDMPTEVLGTTAGPSVEAKGPAVLDRIAAELLDAMAHHRVGDELHIPQHTHLVSARVG